MSEAVPLVRHLERTLGSIESRVRYPRLQIACFAEAPRPGLRSLVSIGVTQHRLHFPNGDECRQEVMLTTHARYDRQGLARILASIADEIIESRHAHWPGRRISTPDLAKTITGTTIVGFCAYSPLHLPEGSFEISGLDLPTQLLWMIPLTNAEMRQIDATKSEEPLVERILSEQPDLFDWHRSSLV